MKPERQGTKTILIDINYHSSLNKFEEDYGENVSYREMEQKSYIDLKDMIFEKIHPDIKFRKFGRISNTLTIKADMYPDEVEFLKDLLKKDKLKINTGWAIKEITIIKDEVNVENSNNNNN